jgi:predicted transcriptional regulator
MEKGKTLKDIARKLNMSISTVSKALIHLRLDKAWQIEKGEDKVEGIFPG